MCLTSTTRIVFNVLTFTTEDTMGTATPKASAPEKTHLTAYKAFEPGMVCRGMQFEVGKTYTHDGDVSLCNAGFHACEIPFDCWAYYGHSMTFARVTMNGVSDETRDDSKRVAASITIEATLTLPEWIKAHVDAVLALCKRARGSIASKEKTNAAATGNYGHAAATGNYGHAAATGNHGHAAATGYYGHAAATGYSGHAAATGDSGHAAATGYSGHAAATGDYGHAAATGDYGHAAATGNYGCSFAGFGGRAKAATSGALAICWYDNKAKRARIVSSNVGENGIKADTWYEVNERGELVEVKS